MAGLIICPKCSNQFEPTDAFREEVQLELRNEAKKWQARKEEEYKQKEAQFLQQIQAKDTELNKRLAEEKQRLQLELKESITKSIATDFENRVKMLQQSVADNEEKLKEARRKELAFLQQEQALQQKEQELELTIQRKEAMFLQQAQAKDLEMNRQFAEEKQKLQLELRESISKSMGADFDNRLKLLQDSLADNEEKLKEARRKELEFLQQEQAFKIKEQELELSIQRRLMEEREKMKDQVWQEETERLQLKETQHLLEKKELQKQLDDQKKLVDELKRKQEQGSMQLQGEVQELLLEEILRSTFPFDVVSPVDKGIKGADCIQTVRNQFGNETGKIIYESKRTKDFTLDWIEKLKKDMRFMTADVAVIVTQTLPKDMDRFGEKDGVYICTFGEVRSVALLLRNSILKIADAKKSQVNRGEKMVMLYDYLTGNEFSEQWKAIREGFMSMKISIQKERDTMEKLWKAREKQLEKVLLNASHIRGSIEGIAGADAVNLNLLDDAVGLLD